MPPCKSCGYELPEGAQYCPRCGTPVVKEKERVVVAAHVERAVSESGLKLAFWWERFVAYLIDVVLMSVVLVVISAVVSLATMQPFTMLLNWPDWTPSWAGLFVNFSLNGLLLFVYWIFMESEYGQSFGKMVMRLKVTRLDGGPLDIGHAALESVGKAFFPLLDFLIGWGLYPRRRQRIFNNISETIVTKLA